MSRSFNWHNATQFLGALNDNVFRWLMVFFLIGLLGDDKASSVTSLTGVVFVIPFLLFTPLAGVLADRFSKRNIIVITKLAELALMVLGWIVFSTHFAMGIYVVLFLMCRCVFILKLCPCLLLVEVSVFVQKERNPHLNYHLQYIVSYLYHRLISASTHL